MTSRDFSWSNAGGRDVHESVRDLPCHHQPKHHASQPAAILQQVVNSSIVQVILDFHGSRYLVTVGTRRENTLCVEVELEADASRWRGEFTDKCAL
jgi:hypothetical protein